MTTTHFCGTERYERVRPDWRYVELEQSPPLESWGKSIAQGLCAVFVGVAVIALLFRVMA